MYTDFFHLKEEPFQVTPDPRYLFLSNIHKKALNQLIDGIRRRKGFIEMVGGVGTGKTLLCRELVQTLSPEMDIAYLFYPIINEEALYYAILHKWGISVPENMPSPLLVERIQEALEERFVAGRNALIILDEAQNLSIELLENLRLLSNLETTSEKLLQILFSGQPEFHVLLKSGKIPQLDQRIRVRVFLEPLDRAMLPLYVYHRLNVAGGDGTLSFSPEALEKVTRYSKGIPRMINAVCERALEEASREGIFNIDASLIRRAEDSLEGRDVRFRKNFTPKRLPTFFLVISAGIFLVVLAFSGWLLKSKEKTPKLVRSIDSVAATEKKLPESKRKHLPAEIVKEKAAVRFTLYPAGFLKYFLKRVIAVPPGERLFWSAVRMAPRDILRLSTPFLIDVSENNVRIGWICLRNMADGQVQVWQKGEWKEADMSSVLSKWTGRCLAPYWLHPWSSGGKSLRRGGSGAAVRDIQRWLKRLGLFEGQIGRFNAETMEAVKVFQKQAGLKPDGVAGPQTLAFLFHWVRSTEKNGNKEQTIEENGDDSEK